MRLLNKFRVSLATLMMLVVMAAASAALFAKVRQLAGKGGASPLTNEVPILMLLGIGLTALALGSWKRHTTAQMMLQVTLACLGYLSLIWMGEAKLGRPVLYWFQGMFALTVAAPLLARSYVKSEMEHGPRREWWKRTCEAIVFSFLNNGLVLIGLSIEYMIYYWVTEGMAGL